MKYFRFLIESTEARVLVLVGLVLNLSSTFGQTFLIALFLPSFLVEFNLEKGEFGTLYSVATLVSALSVSYFGYLIDRVSLRRYVTVTFFALVTFCLLMASAKNIVLLGVAIFGVRLTGQSLLPHASATTLARYFDRNRGKALSLAALGFPIGEAIFPFTVAYFIESLGWRWTWAIVALFAFSFIFPLSLFGLRLVRRIDPDHFDGKDPENLKVDLQPMKHWTRSEVLQDWRFYLLMPAALIPPCYLSALFLFQSTIADEKNWSLKLMAASFIGFSFGRGLSSLVIGPLIDRLGAIRIFPFYLLPLMSGFFLLYSFSGPWVAASYLFLSGLTVGVGSNVKNAFFAELYGTKHLGAIRSMIVTLVISTTAVGPMIAGWFLQWGVAMEKLLVFMLVSAVLATIVSFVVRIHLPLKR